jgi:hypothetical protein
MTTVALAASSAAALLIGPATSTATTRKDESVRIVKFLLALPAHNGGASGEDQPGVVDSVSDAR